MKNNLLYIVLICLQALLPVASYSADLGVPRLSDNISKRNFFDPDRFLTNAGLELKTSSNFSLSPEFGVGHLTWEREAGRGFDEVIHKVHAQAGGKLNLFDTFYLSAAAKIPLYTYEFTDPRTLGPTSYQSSSHHDYDLFRQPGSNLSWTGEMGVRLGKQLDLNVYYDQSLLNSFQGGGMTNLPEERFGTRLIFRFK